MLKLGCPGLTAPLKAAYGEFLQIARAGGTILGVPETPLGATEADPKRYIEFGKNVADLPASLLDLRRMLVDMIDPCGQALAPDLRGISTPLSQMIDQEVGPILRLTWYPEGYSGAVNQPHTDIDLFTILPTATQPGLERLVEGAWLPVAIDENEVAVMPGDILQELGATRAIEHRVVGGGAERISASLFVNAAPSLEISGGVRAGELMKARLDAVRTKGEPHG